MKSFEIRPVSRKVDIAYIIIRAIMDMKWTEDCTFCSTLVKLRE
jgi:hypothetical protein